MRSPAPGVVVWGARLDAGVARAAATATGRTPLADVRLTGEPVELQLGPLERGRAGRPPLSRRRSACPTRCRAPRGRGAHAPCRTRPGGVARRRRAHAR